LLAAGVSTDRHNQQLDLLDQRYLHAGRASAQQNITVTSSGTSAVHISSVQLSGTKLTFTPAATGPRAATLTITDDALNSPQTVAASC
jgi:hypothetical protein